MSLFVCWSSAGREVKGGSSVADQGLTSLAQAADPQFVGSGHDDMWKATPSLPTSPHASYLTLPPTLQHPLPPCLPPPPRPRHRNS